MEDSNVIDSKQKAILKDSYSKRNCVLVRCTFTESGVGYYAMKQQAVAPFLPELSKEMYPWDTKTDWGVWYFRGEKLPLRGHHPVTLQPLVQCDAFEIL